MHALEELRRLRDSMPDLIADQFKTIRAAGEGCVVIVGANSHHYAAPSIAHARRDWLYHGSSNGIAPARS
ncbi:MAG: hypothetical protein PHQ40_17560 [Anaerolineaceae bacterium]|nr:hypothetical protein [Anaerolineaceae bacterium]